LKDSIQFRLIKTNANIIPYQPLPNNGSLSSSPSLRERIEVRVKK
jgi:hypothetical protein